MGISDKTILEPEQPKPGIPLKRSTVIVMAVCLLVLGLIVSLFSASEAPQRAGASAVAKDANELKQVGTAAALAGEKEEALRKQGVGAPAPAASRADDTAKLRSNLAGPMSRDPASAPSVAAPPGVRRDDNSGALYANGFRNGAGPAAPPVPPLPASPGASAQSIRAAGTPPNRAGASDRGLEEDAQARISKSVVLDDGKGDAADAQALLRQTSIQGMNSPPPPAATQAPSAGVAAQIDALKAQLTGQQGQRPSNWVKEYAQDTAQAKRQVLRWDEPPAGFVLRKGKVIPAVTERQINSDLPGTITARVRENVYDARGNLLIPMGSVLIGKYDSQVKVGQERVLFAFEDLLLPNGVSFRLPAAGGADLGGAAGVAGDVDNHFFKMFGTSLLIAVLADRTKQPTNVTSYGSTPMTAAGQVLSDTSRVILDRNRVIPPTITVAQGTRINVEVVADMQFPSAYYPDKRAAR